MATASIEQGFDRRLARNLREKKMRRRELAMNGGSAKALAKDLDAFLDMLEADGLVEETDDPDHAAELAPARFARRVLLPKNQYINVGKAMRLNKLFEAEREFLEGVSMSILQAHSALKHLRATNFDEQPSVLARSKDDSAHEDELLSVMRIIREATRRYVTALRF